MENFRHIDEPTDAKLHAGNYQKRKLNFQGLPVSVENEAGSVRRGVDPDGNPWETRMLYPYGYIRGTLGMDGDQVDVFVGPDTDAALAYVISQKRPPEFSKVDEQKAMLGFSSLGEACHVFLKHYSDSRFLGAVKVMPMADFIAAVRLTVDGDPFIKSGVLFYKSLGPGERWITAHPNGEGTKGVPVLITEHPDGTATVIGGAGGKMNHLKLRGIKPQSDYKAALKEKHAARQEARKQQIAADKAAGIHGEKVAARKQISDEVKKERADFVRSVAELAGWKPEETQFDEAKHAGLSPDALDKARADHEKALFKRAKETVDLNRKMLVEDAEARARSGIGEVPLTSADPDSLSVADLDPMPEVSGAKLGFDAKYGERAGISKEEAQAEAATVSADTVKPDTGKAELRAQIANELSEFALKNPDSTLPKPSVLSDAQKAAALLKAQKRLKLIEAKARDAQRELDSAPMVESKAHVLEVSDAEIDESARQQMEDDIRTSGARSFLSALDAEGGEAKVAGHIGTGAFNSLNAAALAIGGDALIDRSVVDVLGISGAAQVLARRVHSDMGADADKVRKAIEDWHVDNADRLQSGAVAKAKELHDAAAAIELPDASNGFELAAAQEANAKRRDAIAAAQKVLGQAHGEMQAGAALVAAMQGKPANVEVNMGAVKPEQAVIQLRAIGLKPGDYHLDEAGGNLIATVTAAGMDRLAKPIDVEGMAQIRRNLDIMEGKQDEDGWLPIGIANRPDLAMHAEPGVAPRLAKPMDFTGGPEQALKDYIGGRMADGDAMVDILADAQSADFFQKSGDPDGYRKALDKIAPLQSREVDSSADGPHIRYHVTAAAESILRDGFKSMSGGGVGIGSGETTGDTFTYDDRKRSERLLDGMQAMEAVRTSKNPIEEATNLTGKSAEWIKDRGRMVFGDNASDLECALYATSSIKTMGYIPPTSFSNFSGKKRDFSLLPVDVSGGSRSYEKDGEESWTPSSIKPATKPSGKMKPIESLRDAWEGLADEFVSSAYGGDRAPIHKQSFDVDQISVDALHRALSETPEGVAAYKPVGMLSPQERNGLRNWWYANVAKEDPAAAEKRAAVEAHAKNEPEKSSIDMFGDESVNPDWWAWKTKGDELSADAKAGSLDWNRYVEMLGSPAAAIETVQDLIRSHVAKRFADVYNTAKPAAALKVGRTTIRNNLNHLDAVDPEARSARLAKERALIDSLRERTGGKYASGAVKDKLDAQKEKQAAFEQSQMGFFATETAPTTLGADERHTIGHAAEQKLAGMMSVVGQNFKPGQPTKLWSPSMTGGKNYARQRLIKLLEENGRVTASFGPGSGKSLLQLAGFTHLHGKGKVKRGIILAPSVVQGQFGGEALRYLEPGKYKWHAEPGASREDRLKAYRDPGTHFVVATHQSFRDDMIHLGAAHAGIPEAEMADRLQKMTPDQRKKWARGVMDTEGMDLGYMATDESQYTVNREGKENSRLANVVDAFADNAPYYMPSSGDIAKNDVSEVYDVLAKMDRKRYGDRDAFMRRYGGDAVSSREALKREMARYVYSSKIEPDVETDRRTIDVPLNDHQKSALAAMNKDVSAARIAHMSGGVAVDEMKRLSPESFAGAPEEKHAEIAKALQANVGLLRNAATKRIINVNDKGAKLDKASELAAERKGKPGVIFAHNLETVEHLRARLEKEGHRVVTLTGADSSADKDKKRLAFNPEHGDADADIMIASDAGAVGLNLQRGQWLLQMDSPDTAMTHGQRLARIFRTGQKNKVELMDLVADHPSERKARERLAKKYDLRELITSPMEGLDDHGIAWNIRQAMAQQPGGLL